MNPTAFPPRRTDFDSTTFGGVTWPETPLPEESVSLMEFAPETKIKRPKRLTEEDLGEILAAISDASRSGIGTFHMPKYGNMKVKFDRNKQEYYINVR
jgi:hypothetical protein